MTAGDDAIDDTELLAEQRQFYDADAESFDHWLGTLVDQENDKPAAHRYRSGRALIADLVDRLGSLGHVLEIAAGTGRLAELYLPRATSVTLLDTSAASLALAGRRLTGSSMVRFIDADVFDWDPGDETFDTIIFSAWLHHVPHGRFDAFWRTVESLLADSGRVIFDFPDANVAPPGGTDVPKEPAEGYGFYAPVDGISIRDHFGRRWRVVHNLWDPPELDARLAELGWKMTVLGPGMFGNIVWASAHRQRQGPA